MFSILSRHLQHGRQQQAHMLDKPYPQPCSLRSNLRQGGVDRTPDDAVLCLSLPFFVGEGGFTSTGIDRYHKSVRWVESLDQYCWAVKTNVVLLGHRTSRMYLQPAATKSKPQLMLVILKQALCSLRSVNEFHHEKSLLHNALLSFFERKSRGSVLRLIFFLFHISFIITEGERRSSTPPFFYFVGASYAAACRH